MSIKSNSSNLAEEIQALQDTRYVISSNWKLPIINALFNGTNALAK